MSEYKLWSTSWVNTWTFATSNIHKIYAKLFKISESNYNVCGLLYSFVLGWHEGSVVDRHSTGSYYGGWVDSTAHPWLR